MVLRSMWHLGSVLDRVSPSLLSHPVPQPCGHPPRWIPCPLAFARGGVRVSGGVLCFLHLTSPNRTHFHLNRHTSNNGLSRSCNAIFPSFGCTIDYLFVTDPLHIPAFSLLDMSLHYFASLPYQFWLSLTSILASELNIHTSCTWILSVSSLHLLLLLIVFV